jgi:hypothetical protein
MVDDQVVKCSLLGLEERIIATESRQLDLRVLWTLGQGSPSPLPLWQELAEGLHPVVIVGFQVVT